MTNEEFVKLKTTLTSNKQGIASSQFNELKSQLMRQQKLKQQGSVKGGFLGNVLTSSTQKFGRTVGETLALKKNMQLYTDAFKSFTDAQYNLQKTILTNRKAGKDTTRLQQVLSEMKKPNIADFVGEQTARRLNETLAQNIAEIGGQALGTVVEATGVGAIKGVKGLGLVKNVAKTADEARKAKLAYNALSFGGKMGNIAKSTARMVGVALPFGYAYDVSQGLQGERGVGREGGKAFIPGAGTALSVAIPAGVGALRTAQAGFAKVSPTIASNISGEPVQAYERMQTGQLKGMLKGASREKTLDVARGAMTGYRKNMIKEFGENIENLSVKNQGFRIGLDDTLAKKAGKISETFGFDLPQNIKSMSGKEASEFITNLNESYIPNASTANDIALNNSVKTLKNTLMNKANQTFGKEFGDIYKTYAGKSKVYKDIASVIGKVGERTPMQLNAARNRLNNIFAENSSAYLEAVQQFENATGAKILDQVAASRLSPVLPKTLRGGGFNIMGLAGDIFALLTFPISSPRVGGQVVKFLSGMDVNTLSKLPNTVRMAIYNAVDKENMSFNNAVKKYAKDFIKNPKMGLSLEDVSKNQSGKTTWSTDLSTVTTKPITKNQNKTLSTNISKSIPQKTAVGQGNWESQHQIVSNKLYGTGAKVKNKEADIVLGLPASGKSRIFSDRLIKEKGAMLVDADEAKKVLLTLREHLGKTNSQVHSISGDIIEKDLLKRGAIKGDNMVIPMVGKNKNKIQDLINYLNSKGYKVNLHLSEISNKSAVDRATARVSETGQVVPIDYIKSLGDSPTKTFNELINTLGNKNKITGFNSYSNEVPFGTSPKVLKTSEPTFVFVSPNKLTNTTIDDSLSFLKTPAQQKGHNLLQKTINEAKIFGSVYDGVGNWTDGAENTLIFKDGDMPISQLRTLGAKIAKPLGQKQYLWFKKIDSEKDILHEINTGSKDIKKIVQELQKNGIEYPTVNTNGDIYIFNGSGEYFDKELFKKISISLKNLGIDKKKWSGYYGKGGFEGSFLEGEVARSDAQKIYKNIINQNGK